MTAFSSPDPQKKMIQRLCTRLLMIFNEMSISSIMCTDSVFRVILAFIQAGLFKV